MIERPLRTGYPAFAGYDDLLSEDAFPSPARGEGKVTGVVYECFAYSWPSSVSPPETSTLPGFGSRLSFVTTPSSTSIE